MGNFNPNMTPIDTSTKLIASGPPVKDPTEYHNIDGTLQYLTFTRPNNAYDVQKICLFMHDPRDPHLAALRRIFKYVQGTLDLGLRLYASSTTSLIPYYDANRAGCPTTR
ncbi:uncharacterized mitochondrial protein AtMg00810-like [Rutidosis leptorrhynchoides]|uniref:uncharacterized mitochondrial protein AtMg00810-like n=1 Tax=Rutidosis leptorrhynchoides TaxID=125765 RepID=UPI003A99869A